MEDFSPILRVEGNPVGARVVESDPGWSGSLIGKDFEEPEGKIKGVVQTRRNSLSARLFCLHMLERAVCRCFYISC